MSKEKELKEAVQAGVLVMVEFYADWCVHCQRMKPVVQEFKEGMKEFVQVITINVDENKELVESYNVESTPTFILMRNGEQLWRQSGELPLDRLIKAVKDVNV